MQSSNSLIEKRINSKSYYQLFNDLSNVVSKHTSSELLNKEAIELIRNPDFLNFLNSFPCIVAVIDFHSMQYLYLNDGVKELWGYDQKEFYNLGLAKTMTIFPASQNATIIHTIFPLMFEYFNKYAETGEAQDLRVSYNTKVTMADGTEGWCLHQMKVLYTDENLKPQIGLKFVSDITDIKTDEAINMAIAKKDDKGIYKNIFTKTFLCDAKPDIISSREREVLVLLGEGKSSKEIAQLLFITENTVNGHRKNLLKKIDAKSTGELLKKAIVEGIL